MPFFTLISPIIIYYIFQKYTCKKYTLKKYTLSIWQLCLSIQPHPPSTETYDTKNWNLKTVGHSFQKVYENIYRGLQMLCNGPETPTQWQSVFLWHLIYDNGKVGVVPSLGVIGASLAYGNKDACVRLELWALTQILLQSGGLHRRVGRRRGRQCWAENRQFSIEGCGDGIAVERYCAEISHLDWWCWGEERNSEREIVNLERKINIWTWSWQKYLSTFWLKNGLADLLPLPLLHPLLLHLLHGCKAQTSLLSHHQSAMAGQKRKSHT